MFRSALVTGGRSGIGAAIVERLQAEGVDEVHVLDLADGFDVADPAAWDEVPPVELACLNAGVISRTGDVAELPVEEYRRVLAANVDGVVLGTRAVARTMGAGNAIVATASLAGLVAVPGDPVYSLTKHAVLGWVRSVAAQLEPRGIRVNAVCHGLVDTPMTAAVRDQLDEKGLPLIPPAAVADAVLLAATDELTGQAWVVQPGREPLRFRFPGVPGPRGAGEGVVPQL
ncbi:MAG TPA: SDR family NAD(P)-dependent oxidoreductase [Gaiellaceae bacterium]|nr:SDR family NAD(P)-dependent oxidoreductase [Gaiellaceae bacterium]